MEWFDGARLTYQRMPADVQVALDERIQKLFKIYPPLYQNKPGGMDTTAHVQVPAWGCWLVMETENYLEDGISTICVVRLDELAKREFEQSIVQTRAKPGGNQG